MGARESWQRHASGRNALGPGDIVCLVAALAVALVFSIVGLARGAGPPQIPSTPTHSGGIVVTSSHGAALATFRSLQCKISKKGVFTAFGKDGSWTFLVNIYQFRGFHSYDVDYGTESGVDFKTGDGDQVFVNDVSPNTGGPVKLTKGGSVAFPGGRGKLGIAFGIAYDDHDLHSHASLFGTAKCGYPRAKKGKR